MWRSADAVRALYYPQIARIRGAEGQARSPEASPEAKRRGVPERIRDVRRCSDRTDIHLIYKNYFKFPEQFPVRVAFLIVLK